MVSPPDYLSARWLSLEMEAGYQSASCTAEFCARCRSSVEPCIRFLERSICRGKISPFLAGTRITTGCRRYARSWASSNATARPPIDNRGHYCAGLESRVAVTCEKHRARRAPNHIWKENANVFYLLWVYLFVRNISRNINKKVKGDTSMSRSQNFKV